jgi:hypothetical protein
MNHRLEMKADSTSSLLKDRGKAINSHLPAHANIKIYVQRHHWEHRCIHCPAVITTLLYNTSQGTTTGSVCCNHLKANLGPTIRSECFVPLCCYVGHILHTSLLLQWPHTAYQSVVTVVTYCIPVCCYSGHVLHTSLLLQWPHTAYQCFVTVATYCITLSCYSGHILHISVLLQWPHTAYQCVTA